MSWLDRIPGVKNIRDAAGAILTRRNDLQFGAGFSAADDSANEKTVVVFNAATAGLGSDSIADESDYAAGTVSDALDGIKATTDVLAAEYNQYDVLQKDADGTTNTYAPVTNNNIASSPQIDGAKIDPDFGAQTVTCAAVDTSAGTAPTVGAINLINNAIIALASAVSGTWRMQLTTEDKLRTTTPSGYIDETSATFAGQADRTHRRIVTAGTTPDTSLTLDLPDGYFGVVHLEIVAEDQAAPGGNNLLAHIAQRANATSGVLTFGTANADFPSDATGAGSTWTYALSDGGSNVIQITLTGSAAINVTWLVKCWIEYGSLT